MTKAKYPDYLAELHVSGLLADAGWNIYFPHRDRGFDFVIIKSVGAREVMRPVQVKGKYPESPKDRTSFGYKSGELSKVHPAMVLAIPFFRLGWEQDPEVECVAFMPRLLIKDWSRGHRCEPALVQGGVVQPRAHFAKFFDRAGIALMERPDWEEIEPSPLGR